MQLRAFPLPDRAATFAKVSLDVRPVRTIGHLFDRVHPGTWALPVWALVCGALSSGVLLNEGAVPSFRPDALLRLLAGMLLAGPLLTGTSQLVNLFFDREWGHAEGHEATPADVAVIQLGLLPLAAGLLALALGVVPFALVVGGLVLAFALNAPPLYLRRRAWWSAIFASGLSVALPWVLGHALFAPVTLPPVIMAILFSFGALGFHTFFRLPRVERDREHGIRSLAAILGREVGVGVASLVIDTTLLGAAILTVGAGNPWLGAVIAVVLVGQVALQCGFLLRGRRDPAFYLKIALPLYGVAMAVMASSGPANPFAL